MKTYKHPTAVFVILSSEDIMDTSANEIEMGIDYLSPNDAIEGGFDKFN